MARATDIKMQRQRESMKMDDVSSQFLDTFAAIEYWMRGYSTLPKGRVWRLVDDMTDKYPGFVVMRRTIEGIR